MRNRSLILSLALLALASGAARAQVVRQIEGDNTAYGTTAAEFLTFAPTARGAALGYSFAALATDVSAMFYNPAGLSQMARPEIAAATTSYVADTRYSWVGIGIPFGGGARAIGIQIGTFGFADQPVYTVEDPTGADGLVYSVNQTFIGLTMSQQFSDRFSAGITGKYIGDKLGGVRGNAFAIDFGTSFHANVGGRPIRASFTIANLGTTLSHDGNVLDADVIREPPQGQQDVPQEPAAGALRTKEWQLPVNFRVALAYDVFATAMSRLTVMGEFAQPNNADPTFGFAGEYDIKLGTSGFSLAPRVSYSYQSDNNADPADATSPDYAGFDTAESAGMDGFAAGAGLRWQRNPRSIGFGFDYAYRNMGLLGGVNTFSIGMTW
jgi:hypothetical protein